MFSGRTWRWVSNPDPHSHPHPISTLVPCDLHGAPQWHGSGLTTLSGMAHVYRGMHVLHDASQGMFSCRTWRWVSQHVQARQPACCFHSGMAGAQAPQPSGTPTIGPGRIYYAGTGAGASGSFPPAFVRVCVCVRQLAQASRFRVAHANFDFDPNQNRSNKPTLDS